MKDLSKKINKKNNDVYYKTEKCTKLGLYKT